MRLPAILLCACVLAFAAGGSVSANFFWLFNATSTSNLMGGSLVRVGQMNAEPTTIPQDECLPGCASAAVVVLDDPANPATSSKTALYKVDTWPETQGWRSWYAQAWVHPGYSHETFELRIWSGGNSTGTSLASPVAVTMIYDPLGSIDSGTVLLPCVSTATGHTQSNPTATYDLPAYKTDTPMDPGCGYILRFDVLPEPSAILALVAGCGLLALRRRR